MARPDSRLLALAVGGRLAEVGNATGYYAQIGRPLPTVTWPANDERRLGPPVKSTTDQRVKPYFLYTPGHRSPSANQTAGGCDTGAVFRFTVTAVGGDVDDLLALVDRIEDRLLAWTPATGLGGAVAGRVTHPVGYLASWPLTDRDVTPHRLYTAIPFEVAATT